GGFGEQRERRGGVPVDEFGAEFDRHRQVWLLMGPDASADPRARVHDERRDVRARQLGRSGQACGACANDEDVVLHTPTTLPPRRMCPWAPGGRAWTPSALRSRRVRPGKEGHPGSEEQSHPAEYRVSPR